MSRTRSQNVSTSINRAIMAALAATALGVAQFSANAAEPGTPDAYLPFVESSGSQYVDTGVNAQSGTKAEIDFKFMSLPGANSGSVFILGAKNAGDTRVFPLGYNGNTGFGFGYGTYVASNVKTTAGRRFTVVTEMDIGAQSLSTNGAVIARGTSSGNFNLGRNLFLLCNNNSGTPDSYASIRLYRCRIWQKDGNGDYQLVRDFRPCEKDYEACLYDEIEGMIYRSDGSGLFLGPLPWPDASGAAVTNLTTAAYVQDGLAVHFDALRNAGANAPRDPSATNWTDLVSGRTATLTHVASDPDQDSDPGCWTRDAYRFAGHTYFLFDEAFNLGSSWTVQLVCDVEQPDSYSYPMTGHFGVFGAACGLQFWKGGGNNSPQYFLDVYRDNNNFGRTSAWGWDGRRATLMRENANMSRSFTSKRAAPVKAPNNVSLGTSDTPAKRWMIGNHEGSLPGALVGRVHAVRIYGHALTQKEINQNWMVDNARFHDLVPPWNTVLVESNLAGAEGTEPRGAYAVSAPHAFTAPATATIGGNTYRCAGYTLEKFSANTGFYTVWTAPEYHSGETSFAFAFTDGTVDEAYNSVRITWRWELADGVEKIDAGLYRAPGMVANWDGIQNSGAAEGHDSTAEVWRDASGNGLDMERFTPEAGAATGAWTDNGYAFVGNDQFKTAALMELGPQFTWELVTDASMDTARDKYVFGSASSVNAFLAQNPQGYFRCRNQARGSGNWGGKYVAAMRNNTSSGWTQGAEMPSWQSFAFDQKTTGQSRWTIGGIGTADTAFIGSVLAVRVYDRLVPAVELAASRALDEIRFRGAVPETNTVYVETALPGAEGDQECGIYRVAGAGHAFTATERRKVDGIGYAATRCTVETWDAASSKWEDPVSSTGPAWTTPAGDSWASRRITWHWSITGAIIFVR